MLQAYTSAYFHILESWVTDADLLLQFSGTDFSYPITEKQIEDYQLLHPDRRFYIGYTADGVPFAFGEIIPQENGCPRLARILVGNSALRGQGLGRSFIKMLLTESIKLYRTKRVELFTWEKNYAAIRCYESVGFKFLPERCKEMVHNGKRFNIHKMIYTAAD
ncbi:GNAT family N-acetyltransferase [Pedobacter rhizosphaerae]|uniref:Protein N-acetyltransferase, RimJ/RimL family n=1 Tax=Pedobacter rhizosphaerae TaxID=390241 RepID=A0A1H9L6G1_9SPHI|nr:GNAT family N-acetyltransferase [Pedobacter rhizosphaerae]SER06745.1 Protein N-acetyltransferase, RimJ/RimL family [Pedobacter rhizosphaerae]